MEVSEIQDCRVTFSDGMKASCIHEHGGRDRLLQVEFGLHFCLRLVLASMTVLLQRVHPATDKASTRSAKNNCCHVTVQSAKQVSYGGTAIEAANLLSGG